MNKKEKGFKVVQISGLKGLFLICFVLFCLFCGFIIFPVWLIMQVWNYGLTEIVSLPKLSALQGALIWSIVCVLAVMSCRNSFSIQACSEDIIAKDLELKNIVKDQIVNDKKNKKEEIHK